MITLHTVEDHITFLIISPGARAGVCGCVCLCSGAHVCMLHRKLQVIYNGQWSTRCIYHLA